MVLTQWFIDPHGISIVREIWWNRDNSEWEIDALASCAPRGDDCRVGVYLTRNGDIDC